MYVDRVDFGDTRMDHPTWAQVEDTIQRMSQDAPRRNHLQLTCFTHSSGMTIGGGTHFPENDEDLGRDGYMCTVYVEVMSEEHDAVEYVLINENASEMATRTLVVLDDALDIPANYVADVDAVLTAAEHFYLTGAMLPRGKWDILTYM